MAPTVAVLATDQQDSAGRRHPRPADDTRERLREAGRLGGVALRDARQRVIADHLWLARSIAGRYRGRFEDLDDLVQVACIGLVEAVHRFDPEHGDFVSFAVPTIRGVIKRHFRDRGWAVRPPRRTQEVVAEIRREWPGLAQDLGSVPRDADLAARLGRTVAEMSQARSASQGYRPLSLDVMIEFQNQFGCADGEDDQIDHRLIVQSAVRELDEEDRRLIWMRFYQGRSQSDIAVEIGTNQMQVSRRLARLMARLRGIIGTDEPSPLAS